jgi:hypothetical protein
MHAPEDDTTPGIYQAVAKTFSRRGYTQEIYHAVVQIIPTQQCAVSSYLYCFILFGWQQWNWHACTRIGCILYQAALPIFMQQHSTVLVAGVSSFLFDW